MCGPVAAFVGAGATRPGASSRARVAAWLLGRALGYTAAGALAGGAGLALATVLPVRVAQALVSVALAVALGSLGVRLLSPTRGGDAPTVRLGVARPAPSWASRVLLAAHGRPLLLGAAMALIPCGALFAALASAALPGTPAAGALTMLAFAVTSSAGLVLSGWLGSVEGALDAVTRRALGVVLVAGALVLGVRPWWALEASGSPESCHEGMELESRP